MLNQFFLPQQDLVARLVVFQVSLSYSLLYRFEVLLGNANGLILEHSFEKICIGLSAVLLMTVIF